MFWASTQFQWPSFPRHIFSLISTFLVGAVLRDQRRSGKSCFPESESREQSGDGTQPDLEPSPSRADLPPPVGIQVCGPFEPCGRSLLSCLLPHPQQLTFISAMCQTSLLSFPILGTILPQDLGTCFSPAWTSLPPDFISTPVDPFTFTLKCYLSSETSWLFCLKLQSTCLASPLFLPCPAWVFYIVFTLIHHQHKVLCLSLPVKCMLYVGRISVCFVCSCVPSA